MKRAVFRAAGALLATVLTACSPGAVLSGLQPAAPGGELRGIAYDSGPRHSLDIYLPAKGAKPPPVVVFFYGGSWQSGKRESYGFVGRTIAACGAIAYIPDYRVWPETGFPGFMKDAAAAVAFARSDAPGRGGDTSRLFLAGHSAGAYIAVMLELDPTYLAAAGVDARTALAGTVGLAGPYDFLPLTDPVLEQIFAPVGPATQPITFAANVRAPLLLVDGADDKTVDPGNALRLAAKVRESGGRVTTIIYPGVGHIGVVAALGAPFRSLAPVRDDMCRFLGL